jgi:putative peptide zinc metalloprotease protein
MRKLLLVLGCAAVLGGAVAVSPPAAGAGDNAAVALNLRDGSSEFRLAFKITRVNTDVVDTGNAAVAVASCTDCQTVAVAIQAVLIFDDASVITPTNFAFAYNLDCDRCYTLATAYQFVATTGVVRFTADGNQRIAEIRLELEALRNSGLSIEEIQARVDALAAELLDVMRTELVAAGSAGTAAEPASTDTAATTTSTTELTTTDATTTTADSSAADSSTATDPVPTTTDTTDSTATTTDSTGTTTDSTGTTTDSTGTTTDSTATATDSTATATDSTGTTSADGSTTTTSP